MTRNSGGRFLPAARFEGVVVTEAGAEALVYDAERHHIHHLNRTTAVVWRLCDGRCDAEQIAHLASAELGATIDEPSVHAALVLLGEANLLREPLPGGASRISRRWLVKRAAVAGVAAAPLIASTQAARAQGHQSCSNQYASCRPSRSGTYGSSRGPRQGSFASLDNSGEGSTFASSVAGSPCEPGKGQCVVEPYDAWVCYPSTAATGVCGAIDGTPSIGTAIEIEQQLLNAQAPAVDDKHLVDPLIDPPVDPPTDPPTDPPADSPPDPPADPSADPPIDTPADPLIDPPVDPPAESGDAPAGDAAETTGG